MVQNNIPSKEDFLRAKSAMRKDDRGLSEVRERVLSRFKAQGLHEFIVLFSRRVDSFGAYVFFETDSQVGEAVESGLEEDIKEVVLEELERVDRGLKEADKINFEFDSHENVVQNYEGDYYNRLR